MHELFHDLATSVSKNQYFRCEEPFCSLAENIGNLSIVLSDFKTVALAKEARNLQCFLVVRGSFPVVRILNSDDLFVKFRFLRALNLIYRHSRVATFYWEHETLEALVSQQHKYQGPSI